MPKLIDLTGKVYGRLLVLSRAENIDGRVAWNCLCACGNTCIVRGSSLRKKNPTQSCGCLRKEKVTKHGMSYDPLFVTHRDMIQRTTDPNATNYDEYGGRGIKVCERWLKFENFFADVSILPHYGEVGYSLDRINNDGNYEPSNIRWADKKTQNRNTRQNHFVDYQGRKITIAEASDITGINYKTLWKRIKAGDTGDRLYRPVRKKKA